MSNNKMSDAIKNRWHAECFVRVGVSMPTPENKDRKKYHFEPTDAWVSLRRYAKNLASQGDTMATDWFAHKDGSLNQECSDTNLIRIRAEKQATKLSRRKSKTGASTAVIEKAAGGKKNKGI